MNKPKSNEPALAMCCHEEQWNILKELRPDALDDNFETWREPTAPYKK